MRHLAVSSREIYILMVVVRGTAQMVNFVLWTIKAFSEAQL